MSGPEHRPPDDELLDRYLDGKSEVSRAYRQAPASQPPADLDRRIVDMARSEHVRRIWPFLRDRRIDAYGDLLKRYRD